MTRNLVFDVIGAVALLGGLTFVFSLHACTGTPDERAAKFAKGAADLCALRATEARVEEAFPDAKPVPGSTRDKIEAAEDKFCALRAEAADASTPPPASS